jgi:hypothetical protein
MSPDYDWRLAADYARRAVEHRPANPEQLRTEAKQLQQTGLKPRDIATALGLDPEQVRVFLETAA